VEIHNGNVAAWNNILGLSQGTYFPDADGNMVKANTDALYIGNDP
jgi:hypothetical protein